MRTENESLTGASPLELLFDLAKETDRSLDRINEAFLCEFISLFRGITGKAGKHTTGQEVFSMKDGREAAILRSEQLDDYAGLIRRNFRRYRTGFDRTIVRQRQELKKEILELLRRRGKPVAGLPMALSAYHQGSQDPERPCPAGAGRGGRTDLRQGNAYPL